MKQFEINVPTKFYHGPGCLDVLQQVCNQFGQKAFIVTTGNDMERLGILDKVTKILKKQEVDYIVFDKITPNPKASEIDEGALVFKESDSDFLIALGGGSSIDAAKNISMVVANQASISDYLPGGSLVDLIERKSKPLIVIPTTAGTGSEVTKTAVVTNDKTHEKYGVRNECIYPNVSIVDPNLMLSAPKFITAITGIDVFFHAMEAYLSNKATPFTDMAALTAMSLVIENLETVCNDGSNLEARANMAWASTLGGFALDTAIVVGIHGLGQPIGGFVDAVHGQTLCAVSHAYMKYTWKSDIDRYARISEILGVDSEMYSKEEMAEMSGDVLQAYLNKLDLTVSLQDLGVKKEMIPDIAHSVLRTTKRTLECSKMEINFNDIVTIYTNSLQD